MNQQTSFAQSEYARKKKTTRREKFLSQMEQVVPWARLVAVIMTGMGDDGAESIQKVRERGGRTIAESAQSAIIFGMPNEAIKTGAVEQILPLSDIPLAIQKLCTGSG